MQTLTFIRNGNMAKAMMRGLLGKYNIEVYGRNETTLNNLKKEMNEIEIHLLSEK